MQRMLLRRKLLHSGVLWSPLWESHRMDEAGHKEWCQPPCSTMSSHLLDSALWGRKKKCYKSQTDSFGYKALPSKPRTISTGVWFSQVLTNYQESRQALLRKEESALVCADTMLSLQSELHSKVKNNLFLGNWSSPVLLPVNCNYNYNIPEIFEYVGVLIKAAKSFLNNFSIFYLGRWGSQFILAFSFPTSSNFHW